MVLKPCTTIKELEVKGVKPYTNMSKSVKREKQIEESIKKDLALAQESDGYMLAITRLDGEKLTHSFFTVNFKQADVIPSLGEMVKVFQSQKK